MRFSREQKNLVRRATVSLVFMIWDARTTCGSARRQLIEQSLHAIIPQNHLHAAPLGIPGHWPFAIKRCFLERIKIRKWHRPNVSNPLVFLRALPQRSLKLAIIYIYTLQHKRENSEDGKIRSCGATLPKKSRPFVCFPRPTGRLSKPRCWRPSPCLINALSND